MRQTIVILILDRENGSLGSLETSPQELQLRHFLISQDERFFQNCRDFDDILKIHHISGTPKKC